MYFEEPAMFACTGYAATAADARLAPFSLDRRDPGPRDVRIDITHCGVCHSDIHTARSEWPGTLYPCVPGHEIVGRVAEVGAEVTKYKVGDQVGVGCMVDSCRECESCRAGLEQYCEPGARFTYNSPDIGGLSHTFGGYAQAVVVDQDFVLRIPEGLDLAAAAPLLCAGITTWSPLRHWGIGPGKRVGVVGLGGLGHMGVKLAVAMGAEVTLFTTSANKAEDGRRLGAHRVVISRDADAMKAEAGRFDFILDCVSAQHDINAYFALLRLDGALVQVGLPEKPIEVQMFSLVGKRRTFAGSLIGGIAETQEMLDFCGEHGITADIEMIAMDEINEAYERMIASDVKYRFVIDMATMPKAA
ncbi:alcohol dehydrogenase zinc-binding domain-containing protein [Tanticharoenia sakaeratensis NBRC 103193]|uniref:Alcohol dehydrogenase zinc-binding domain-containing protein n=2 Tax=Tanticharoenia TaxID=444052 RepID=A0A0D6MHH8_9PROT|nr:alcohol dehydrogenase zinc-binding domain-containing protein [Tanticharoenia sakaeratensis NBRC 103193]GBQ18206.1 zinc-dependent alcohol dehydrogenase [Tanticharoenia sakaeratensis NBRC 103193]